MATSILSRSLGHVEALLASAAGGNPGLVRTLSGTDLAIDLPAFHGGAAARVSPEALRILASLYFLAEIEGTHLVSVAEELATARFTLNLTDREAAAAIEAMATAMRDDWIDRNLRNQIFARVFGLGYADPTLGETAVNREFEPRFARLAVALIRVGDEARWGTTTLEAATIAGFAAQSVLANLGRQMQGNTLIVAEKLAAQLRLAITALDHPGVGALFMARSAWDVVRAVLGPETPDLNGHVTRAQTGLRLLSWMSGHAAELAEGNAGAALAAEPKAPSLAGQWLRAAGAPEAGRERHKMEAGIRV